MTTPSTRPALCEECKEAPARRILGERWVCEGCYTEAELAADRARRGPPPPAERAVPEPKMWHPGTYGGVFRCVQTNSRGTQLRDCGLRHPMREDAQAHATRLNEAMANYQPAQLRCARHKTLRLTNAAERYSDTDGSLCPICEAGRYARTLLQGLPEAGAPQWDDLSEWEQGFVTSVRTQLDQDVALTVKQVATIEKLYRQVWNEPEPV